MQHPDEGTIHAWLDGALPPAEAAALEAHVAGCAACTAAVAEARGLLAASSRILSALDSVPGGVLPARDASRPNDIASMKAARVRNSRWQSTPWRAAAAIVVIGSVGWLATRSAAPTDTLRHESVAMHTVMPESQEADTAAAPVPASAAPNAGAARRVAAAPAPRRVTPTAPAPARSSRMEATTSRMESATASPPSTGQLATGPIGATSGGQGSMNERVAADSSQRDVALADASARRLDPSANLERRAEQSMKAAATVMAQSAPAMARINAPTAALMPGAGTLQRLVGCYAFEPPAWSGTPAATMSKAAPSSFALPAHVELRATPGGSVDPGEMLLRPAPGEPAFASGVQGGWKPLGPNTIALRISNGTASVDATLSLDGDRVSGEARADEPGVAGSGQPRTAALKGRKTSCRAP